MPKIHNRMFLKFVMWKASSGGYIYQFCSDWMSGSHLTVQVSIFLLIGAIAMTTGQGHWEVIQYISPDQYFYCPKYLRFRSNCLDARSFKVRSHMRGRTRAEAGGKLASTQLITCVHICAVAERRRSGSKIGSARNGSNERSLSRCGGNGGGDGGRGRGRYELKT